MGAFKLGKMTFGSLFKQPETVQYPFQTKPQPEGLKGHIRIDVDACILCGICERNCTTGCITVDKPARTWSIDAFGCIQCKYCTTVCPKKCLYMEPDYHPAAPEMSVDTFTVPEQEKAPKPVKAEAPEAAKPEAPKGAVAPEEAVKAIAEKAVASVEEPAASYADPQVDALLSLMDATASEKVRAALA